jgi:hypothetical protein
MTPEVTKIGNKLFDKVELASQRIELGLIDDINKLKIEANNIEDSAVSEIKKSISILDNASNILDKAILSSKSVIDQIDKAKIMAKELGIDLPNNIDASYKYYQDSIKSYTLMKNTISSFSTKINSI